MKIRQVKNLSTKDKFPQPQVSTSLDASMATEPKPWGMKDNKELNKLVETGEVDLDRINDIKYVEEVRYDHFRHRLIDNFKRNIRKFASSYNLNAEQDGERRRQGEGMYYC